MRNYGLLLEQEASSKDWVMGGVTGIIPEILQPTGDWSEFLPIYEPQYKGFDTYSCVSYSANNCLETIYNRKYGLEENFSDRYPAKTSGTTPSGNTFSAVANSILKYGIVREPKWPFSDDIKNWNEYMDDIPVEVLQDGQSSFDSYDIRWEWANSLPLTEALKYSPLQIGVHAWEKPVNGIYQRTDKPKNHAVMLYAYKKNEYWLIYDHYHNEIKKLAWDFWFGSKLRYNISNTMPKQFDDNLLVMDAQDTGAIGMTLDGKIILDDLAKVHAMWSMRTDGDVKGKTKSLTKEEWDAIPKINLQKEPV